MLESPPVPTSGATLIRAFIFLNTMKLKVAINTNWVGKHPPDMAKAEKDAWFRRYNGGFENYDIEVDQFIKLVAKDGYGFTPCVNGYRHSRNFIQAQHVGVDIDGGMEIEEALSHEFVERFASFLYTTPSHKPNDHHFRIVFVLDRPIKNKDKYVELVKATVDMFGRSDPACKDAARLFYGSKNSIVHILGNVLTLEEAAKRLVFPYRKKRQKEPSLQIVTPAARVTDKRVTGLIESLAEKIRICPDGEKYITLRDISRTAGGYVSGGVFGRDFAISQLWEAIKTRRTVQDWDLARETIVKHLEYGMKEPLYLTERPYSRPSSPLDSVSPPLSPVQRKQVEDIIARMQTTWAELHHDRVSQAAQQQFGLPDYVLDLYQLSESPAEIDAETGEILRPPSLVIPYLDGDGTVLNIEYRTDGGVSYESDEITPMFLTDPNSDGRTIMLPDSMTAIHTYLNLGHIEDNGTGYRIVGLPHLALTNVPDENDPIILLSPGDRLDGQSAHFLKKAGATSVELPLSIEQMIAMGMKEDVFKGYLKQQIRL